MDKPTDCVRDALAQMVSCRNTAAIEHGHRLCDAIRPRHPRPVDEQLVSSVKAFADTERAHTTYGFTEHMGKTVIWTIYLATNVTIRMVKVVMHENRVVFMAERTGDTRFLDVGCYEPGPETWEKDLLG